MSLRQECAPHAVPPLHTLLPGSAPIAIALCVLLTPQAFGQSRADFHDLVFEPRLINIDSSVAAPDESLALASASKSGSGPAGVNSEDAGEEEELLEEIIELNNSISRYQEIIAKSEAYDNSLSQAYMALGSSLQQKGELIEARNAFLEALQVTRANSGLFSLEQKPILEKIVEVHLANGDIEEANAQQEHLTYIQEKTYGELSPELLTTLNDYADWNLSAASYNLGFVPEINDLDLQPVNFFDTQMTGTISPEETLFTLQRAQQNYAQMLRILMSGHDGSDLRIPEVEKKLALTYYLTAYVFDNFQRRRDQSFTNELTLGNDQGPQSSVFVTSGSGPRSSGRQRNVSTQYYAYGRNALIRRLFYLENIPDVPIRTVVEALVDLADWYLLFDRWNTAQYVYESSRDLLAEHLGPDQEIEGLVYPNVPTHIPSFTSPRYSKRANNIPRDALLDYEGYIDVAFELSRVGLANNVEVLGKSEETRRETEEALLDELGRSQFRLQLTENEPSEPTTFRIRYYYANQTVTEE